MTPISEASPTMMNSPRWIGHKLTAPTTFPPTPQSAQSHANQAQTPQSGPSQAPSNNPSSHAPEDQDIYPGHNPYPFYPKPVSNLYRNVQRHYNTWQYLNGERMEACSTLVSSILHLLFPRPEFETTRLPYQDVALVNTVALKGAIYFTVTVNSPQLTRVSDGDTQMSEPNDLSSNQGLSRTDTSRPRMLLLVIIGTEAGFRNQIQRTQPRPLTFSKHAYAASGLVCINGVQYQCGHVVVMGSRHDHTPIDPGPLVRRGVALRTKAAGKTNKVDEIPAYATWEFYAFNVMEHANCIMPWNGGLGTSVFSIKHRDVEDVFRMFGAIVQSFGNGRGEIGDTGKRASGGKRLRGLPSG
ncbi:hypothetical protein M011DRAFT_467710 [Sporormia fimetaria CBS 119925]|uniref:Uncharacterized protein n=1 Tax=Sporormia fimetaria CBS 119925 TaxID=1340428 RepID=A0A6A6VD60_9PLEO|nr:hypothetical protein M011DRAFT_467710 [Sporormia fimetaria CBS 119925]